MRLELEKPTDSEELLTLRKSDNGAIDSNGMMAMDECTFQHLPRSQLEGRGTAEKAQESTVGNMSIWELGK